MVVVVFAVVVVVAMVVLLVGAADSVLIGGVAKYISRHSGMVRLTAIEEVEVSPVFST